MNWLGSDYPATADTSVPGVARGNCLVQALSTFVIQTRLSLSLTSQSVSAPPSSAHEPGRQRSLHLHNFITYTWQNKTILW
ncbi:hypothetical protein GALMADRAFT_239285 [Galerina marginata CBS 339.88]|uniref:Uncharacterized protein n=1 Tax=Galerina marginata (strain CBS 339.88) TaxID=685588 RepID=A0A067TGC9_GALM3|nr:hypothetical protein GALMADRAFT_239285 [Galerina marginata CBS 339.88]